VTAEEDFGKESNETFEHVLSVSTRPGRRGKMGATKGAVVTKKQDCKVDPGFSGGNQTPAREDVKRTKSDIGTGGGKKNWNGND